MSGYSLHFLSGGKPHTKELRENTANFIEISPMLTTTAKENKHLAKKDRKGMFTTGLISEGDFGRIVLYLSGRKPESKN